MHLTSHHHSSSAKFVASLSIIFLGLLCHFVVGQVKSILAHSVKPPEALAAKYYKEHKTSYDDPACAKNLTGPFAHICLHDPDYPLEQIEHAIKYHYHAVASIYKDVLLTTDLSVDGLATLEQENTYLCPSRVEYAKPLRALNSHGKWRIIVNDIPANYDHLTQTVRIEQCHGYGYRCRLIPECYESQCVQKFTYHRFLVYNPKDYYYPFKVESFKMPSSCDCLTGHSHYKHEGRKYYSSHKPEPHHSYKDPSILYYNDHKKLKHPPKSIYEHAHKKETEKQQEKVPHYVDNTKG